MRDWLHRWRGPRRLLERSASERQRSNWRQGMVVVSGLLLVVGQYAWMDPTAQMTHRDMAWVLLSQLALIGMVMCVVQVVASFNRKQLALIAHSSAELEKTNQTLLRAQAQKVEFLATIGHELRTPMNAILGLNGLLRSDLGASAHDVEIVDHIRRATEQLLQLVNHVLDFSQLQAGRMTWHEEDVDLREALDEAVAAFASQAQDKGVRLTRDVQLPENLWVVADRQRLVQILANLLANAVQMTATGSIHVCVKSEEVGFLFEVQDTGMGMSVDQQQHAFLGFAHADLDTNRHYGGTGLGLAISERLVTLQGGTIGLTSELGRGSRVWFHLPLRRATAHTVKANADVAQLVANGDLKILLVDDNDVNLIVARMLLHKCLPKATVIDVSSAALALEQLRRRSFDVVLMDVIMPEMDGMQATQIIRQSFPSPVSDIPVLALTASASPVDQANCLNAGMNDVLLKPLVERALLAKISKAMAAHAQRGAA